MDEAHVSEKVHSKNKTVDRISRLFLKKKKSAGSSSSVSSLSEPSIVLSQQATHASTISLASSHIESYPLGDEASIHSKLTRTMSIKSTKQWIQQQRHLLEELDTQKSVFQSKINQLTEQCAKQSEKVKQRQSDMTVLENNYQAHLRSVRSSDDDPESIGKKILSILDRIRQLASQLVPYADPMVTTDKLSTLWLNLGPAIERLGKPLAPHRLQMLVEKFMMDVLVQNLNTNFFPGLTCNEAFVELQEWLDENDVHLFSTRLRQELAMIIVQQQTIEGSDVQLSWQKAVDRHWHHLYRGLQKAFPAYLKKSEMDTSQYSQQLRQLVEDVVRLGSAMKGQELTMTAVDVREGIQPLDSQLMDDVDGQQSGIIAFCISPPFVVHVGHQYKPLVKGRVLCFLDTN
ncbi:hypothetical protein EDC96DRAFT_526607 [Choanephora cucurbitarum]|nr:hypothetical protein EDC96DRAFT_526607 [Choanephora cucurbitarum]